MLSPAPPSLDVDERTSLFISVARELANLGFVIFPVAGDGSKRPLIRGWRKLHRPPSERQILRWAAQFEDAILGIACGAASGITVVDYDDPKLIPENLGTPLLIRTPRDGGLHAYFRYGGEGKRRGQGWDILGDGAFVIPPPFFNPKKNGHYEFANGSSWDDLDRIPEMPKETISSHPAGPKRRLGPARGERNNTLFHRLLREAKQCDSCEALVDVACTWNDSWDDPLPDDEVIRTARSAWDYETGKAGRENWVGGERRIYALASEIDTYLDEPRALTLLLHLRKHHAPDAIFAVCAQAMAGTSLPWSNKTIAKCLRDLLERGSLRLVHRGGRFRGDPHLYCFGSAGIRKGEETTCNINRTSFSSERVHSLVDDTDIARNVIRFPSKK